MTGKALTAAAQRLYKLYFAVFALSSYPSCCLVARSCLILFDHTVWGLPGSSIYGISQTRIPEWAAFSFSGVGVCGGRGDLPEGSSASLPHCRWILYHRATREAPYPSYFLNFLATPCSFWDLSSPSDC